MGRRQAIYSLQHSISYTTRNLPKIQNIQMYIGLR